MIRGSEDGWSVVIDGLCVEHNRAIEGLFTLGSGYLHIRGSLEEHFEDDPQNVDFTRLPTNVTSEKFRATKAKWGTYVPGIYGRHPLLGNELINLPWACGLEIFADGERLDVERSDIRKHFRALRLRSGWINRSIDWRLKDGTAVEIRFQNMILANDPGLIVQLFSYSAERDVSFEVRATLDADVRTNGLDHCGCLAKSALEPSELRMRIETDRGDLVSISSFIRYTHEIDRYMTHGPAFVPLSEPKRLALTVRTHGTKLRSGSLLRQTRISTSRDAAGPGSQDEFARDPLQAMFRHAQVWMERWESCGVEIEGDPESQLAIRVALYHLLRAHVNDSRVAIDAKGYSGDAYWGRFFWDTEMFLLPFYLYTAPEKARTLVDFRVNTLPGARRNAARYGYPGARYAWESDPEGDECCPNWQYADHEVHVTADVVHGLAHYAAATGDEAYLRGAAADVLIETARYWMARIDWTSSHEATQPRSHEGAKRPVLLGVMGPDEYTPISDNNAFTNRIVAFALARAADVAEQCSRNCGAQVAQAEFSAWRQVAAGLPIPRHPNNPRLVLQSDGFEKLAEPRFDELWRDRGRTFASQVSQERLYRGKCLKQADVLMLMMLFPHEFSDQEVRAAWDYYLPYTTHDSSLSPGVHALIAGRLGLAAEAWDFWKRSCAVDLDIERGGAAEGVHIANFGAMWQIVIFGFAGVRTALQSELLTLDPHLPETWTALRFPLIWKGVPVGIEIDRGGVRLTNRGQRPIDVDVRGEVKSVAAGKTRTWPL